MINSIHLKHCSSPTYDHELNDGLSDPILYSSYIRFNNRQLSDSPFPLSIISSVSLLSTLGVSSPRVSVTILAFLTGAQIFVHPLLRLLSLSLSAPAVLSLNDECVCRCKPVACGNTGNTRTTCHARYHFAARLPFCELALWRSLVFACVAR